MNEIEDLNAKQEKLDAIELMKVRRNRRIFFALVLVNILLLVLLILEIVRLVK